MCTKILLAEDQIVMRAGLGILINQQADMEVVGQADNGRMAVHLALELKPDAIIMDVAMPDMNGIEATALIKEKLPDTKIIALSAHNNCEYVMGMIKAGVSGYLLKDCAFEELVKAIETVMQGKSYLSPEIATVVIEAEASGNHTSGGTSLNERDLEVIKLLAQGKSARKIAESLSLSVKTIEGRRRKIMEKLNIDSIAELVRFALAEGLIPPDPRK